MIPIRDTIRSETYPIVNLVLIAVNVGCFLVQLSVGMGPMIHSFGLVPLRYSHPAVNGVTAHHVIALFSFMFLHGGFLHLIGNMWSLYIFGDNVEDHLGHLRYLAFYILCGLASGATHLALNWHSSVPTIGASGAIAGVMGAYFILYPRAKVLTLIPIFFFIQFVELPAFVFLGIWILFQFINAAGASSQAGGIAWWAHIGGFAFGMAFLKLFALLPEVGPERRFRSLTHKQSSPRVQVLRPAPVGGQVDTYDVITITPREARFGARKVMNIAQGFKKKTFLLTVPPGISEGSKLRLRGMGRRLPTGEQGDLYLKVYIRD